MISLIAAIQFLTAIPPLIRRPLTDRELGRAVAWYPLVGLLLGAILWLLNNAFAAIFPTAISMVLTVAAWLVVTRALHFDGFLDVCDAIFGGFTPSRRLEIMRDPHAGAFAVAGGALLLLIKVMALSVLAAPAKVLFVAPVLGRWAMSLLIVLFPYARQQGLGRAIKDNTSPYYLAFATFLTFVAVVVIDGTSGLVVLLLATITALLAAAYLLRLLPGLTGDTYGAACELVETMTLLFFVATGG